ncbi:uncharacterized protein LOC112507869 [Cynara cardunculus var. scolymus]|uniref:Uncharacterized protein n=1 Tax=Cynara cardunculus var. scolymus TaxID=59895 RepID=A0A103YMA0_CYNCS|nr:uncharacterized protein LOC112507869 [Cynara cardunculus var. scolymus]XP_024968374.1 uncharacterized protein LOC112507869 [Cynara cardunculus var. scolymus]KVI11721.1 hypothetical protein Ccrd_009865 [Cynara cardunculus var. scolymus]
MRKKDGFDSYPHEDARFRHQTLVQDYLQLQKETETARTKLEAMKLKKLTLQAQVRFLRRRHKFLLKNKSSTRQEHTIVKPRFVETSRYRKSMNEKVYSKNEAALQNMNHNAQKKNVLLGIPSHMLHGAMEDAYYSNQAVRTNPSDLFDSSKETPVKSRPPTFDLNQISREEEEELQEGNGTKDLVRSVIDEKLNDLNLLTCGNVGLDSSTSQARKRKISWQDPVALHV